MAKHVQRKRFDHPQLAAEQAAELEHPRWKVPGVRLSAEVVETDGLCWLYLTHEGDLISQEDPLLPDYERVP